MRLVPVPSSAPGKRAVIWGEDPVGEVRSWEAAFTLSEQEDLETHAFVSLDPEDIQQILEGNYTFRIVFLGTNLPQFAVSGIEPEWSLRHAER